jgi:hypothetical protein
VQGIDGLFGLSVLDKALPVCGYQAITAVSVRTPIDQVKTQLTSGRREVKHHRNRGKAATLP